MNKYILLRHQDRIPSSAINNASFSLSNLDSINHEPNRTAKISLCEAYLESLALSSRDIFITISFIANNVSVSNNRNYTFHCLNENGGGSEFIWKENNKFEQSVLAKRTEFSSFNVSFFDSSGAPITLTEWSILIKFEFC